MLLCQSPLNALYLSLSVMRKFSEIIFSKFVFSITCSITLLYIYFNYYYNFRHTVLAFFIQKIYFYFLIFLYFIFRLSPNYKLYHAILWLKKKKKENIEKRCHKIKHFRLQRSMEKKNSANSCADWIFPGEISNKRQGNIPLSILSLFLSVYMYTNICRSMPERWIKRLIHGHSIHLNRLVWKN